MKTVIKRGGSIEPFNLEKIQVVIHRACKDLDVNPLELEATVNTTVKDGTSTETIQQSLIEKAKSLISLEESDWTYVAGRLAMQQYRKNCIRNRKIDYGPRSFVTYLKSQIDVNRYDSQLLNYSEEQLEQIANFLAVERDDNNNIGSVDTITKKYLLPNELIQEAYLVIAMMLHLDTLSVEAVKTTYDYISNKKISLATPVFLNLRKPDSSLSSCFIIDLDDDLEEILRNHANTARISKNSGGVGTLYSRVRAAGSYFQGEINKSGGTIPFIKITNDYAVAVNQGGKRAGAVTPGLDIWHADVPDFIEMRRETGSDIRQKCLDVFPQLIIPDLFMKYLKHNMTLDQQKQTEEQWVDYKYWYLVCPYEIKKVFGVDLVSLWGDAFEQFYEGTLIPHIESDTVPEKDKLKIVKKVKPIDIIREVINSYLETGLPYLVFKDTINKYNVNKHDGFIGMVNLCVESFSNFKNGVYAHCCNLLHINLANIDSWEELEEVTKWIIKLLDRMIDLTNAPIPEANAHNRHYRTIGQCSIGLADWLAKNNKNYHTGREWIRETYERMALAGIEASVELAKEKGAYEAFEGSEWANGNLISKPIEWYQQNAQFPERWEQLRTEVMKHGIRNSELTAVAPNTTSSLAQGCTASFLPPYSRFFVDSSSKGAIPQIPQYIKDKFMFYTENLYFPQEKLIEIVGQDIQPYITAGISMELSFPIVDEEGNKLKKSKLRDCIIKAWEEECKAIYYIRTRRNENDLDSCSMCAG